jgi:hypothetical protein
MYNSLLHAFTGTIQSNQSGLMDVYSVHNANSHRQLVYQEWFTHKDEEMTREQSVSTGANAHSQLDVWLLTHTRIAGAYSISCIVQINQTTAHIGICKLSPLACKQNKIVCLFECYKSGSYIMLHTGGEQTANTEVTEAHASQNQANTSHRIPEVSSTDARKS